MVAPVGVLNINDNINPITKDNIEINILDITTLLNFLKIFIELKAGNIIKLDINNDPINLIPITTTKEHSIANIALYTLVLIPIDLENVSSNVIANILL